MENILAVIFMLSVIVEALIDYATNIFTKEGIEWKKIAALVLGIFLALAAGADLLAQFGLVFQIPYVGTILTGIFFSRGSNYMSDLLKRISVRPGI